MKKLVLLFFMCSGIMFGTQIKDVNKRNAQTVTVEEIIQLKSENEELKNKVADLEKVVNSVKDVKEASNIYYNVDQFYKSSWEKLLWVVGVCGAFITILITILGFIFTKYENKMKDELDNKLKEYEENIRRNKEEIKEQIREKIENYTDVISNYKKDTIAKAEDVVLNFYEQENIKQEKIMAQELEKLKGLLVEKSDELREQIIIDEKLLESRILEFNYISSIKIKMNLYNSNNKNSEKVKEFEGLVMEVNNSKEIQDIKNKNELLSSLYFSLGYFYIEAKNYEKACECYLLVANNNPNDYEVFYNWGTALVELAKFREGTEKEDLLYQAIEKYRKAIEIKADMYEAFYNWGTVLGELAGFREGTEKEDLLNKATEKFKRTTEINPNMYEAFYNFGIAIGKLAEIKEGIEKEKLFNQAIEKFKRTTEINPGMYDAFYNWGLILEALAKVKKGTEKEELLNESIQKYKKVTEINPNDYEVFCNWCGILLHLASMTQGSKKENLINEAIDKGQMSIDLGGKYYNLSCAYAVKGEKVLAIKNLNIALEGKEITTKFIKEDIDWGNYIEDEDFKELIEKYENTNGEEISL